MKRIHMLISFSIVALFSVLLQKEVQAKEIIEVEKRLAVDQEEIIKKPLTNTAVQLYGLEQEKTFYYEINAEPTSDHNEVVIYLTHSELLVAPSSITISVDGEPVITKPIHNEETVDKLVVPLTGKALEKGFHHVTVSFYGVIKEGICVAQDSSGNWMSIGVESYFQLSNQEEEKSLGDFPTRFIGSKVRPTILLLPDEASPATLNNGLMIAASLAQQTDELNTVITKRESEIDQITGNLIVVGAVHEFQTPFLKDLLRQSEYPKEKDAMILSRHRLVEDAQSIEALLVLGDSAEAISKRIEILLNPHFSKQLSNQQMAIQTIPKEPPANDKRIVTLDQMHIPDLTLNHFDPASEVFYYYAPTTVQSDGKTTLELNLKHSESLRSIEQQNGTDGILNPYVELTILVNDIPHSVDLRNLNKDENGVYTIKIPISAKQVNENRLMSLQFKVQGLRNQNPCVSTDHDLWLYLSNDSFFTFPDQAKDDLFTFSNFPYPFIEQGSETIIVLPREQAITDEQLLMFYRAFQMNQASFKWELVRSDQVTSTELKGRNMIFLGGERVHPILAEQKDLMVHHTDGGSNLADFGFLPEAVKRVGWIQKSPWDEKQAMFVLDQIDASSSLIDEKMLSTLMFMEESSTVAVQTSKEQIYTNAEQFKEKKGSQEENEQPVTFSIWLVVSFIGLVLLVIVAIYMALRRQRKQAL